MDKQELWHHGILGMKWGVRRFQNPDGSLTEEGRKRYGSQAEEISRLGVALAKKPKGIIGGFMTLRKIRKDIKRERENESKNVKDALKKIEEEIEENYENMSDEDQKKLLENFENKVLDNALDAIKNNDKKKTADAFSKIGSDTLEPIWKKHADLIEQAYKERDYYEWSQKYPDRDGTELFDEWQDKWGRKLCKELGIPYNDLAKGWIVSEIFFGDD